MITPITKLLDELYELHEHGTRLNIRNMEQIQIVLAEWGLLDEFDPSEIVSLHVLTGADQQPRELWAVLADDPEETEITDDGAITKREWAVCIAPPHKRYKEIAE